MLRRGGPHSTSPGFGFGSSGAAWPVYCHLVEHMYFVAARASLWCVVLVQSIMYFVAASAPPGPPGPPGRSDYCHLYYS